jgi:hypothetical protein
MPENDLNSTIEVMTYPQNDGEDDFSAAIEISPSISLSYTDYNNNIAGGSTHTLVRYFDGHLESFGSDLEGEVTNTPTGTAFVQVAAGDNFSLALKDDGSIVGWGGITGVPTGSVYVQISAGKTHALVLKNDGHVVSFGTDEGTGKVDDIFSHGGITQVAAGNDFSLAIYQGKIFGVGNHPTLPAGNDFVEVSAGNDFGVARRSNGTIVSFGDDSYNQVTDIPTTTNFVAVDCGDDFAIGLNLEGKLNVWGRDNYNQIIAYPDYDQAQYSQISAGGGHGIAMAPDGTLKMSATVSFLWGRDDHGQVSGTPEYIGQSVFEYVPEVALQNVSFSPNVLESANPMNLNFSATLEETTGEPIQIAYKIYLRDSVWKNVSYYTDTPIQIDETFDYDEMTFGNNEIRFEVTSDQELKTNDAGTVAVSKINNAIQELEFSEDLIAKETLVKALHTNELISYVDDEMDRRDVPRSGCNSGCAGLCQGCSGTCGGNCAGDCAGSCSGGCTGSCGGGCGGGCRGCSDRWF